MVSPAQTSDPLLERLRLATVGSYDLAGELGRGGMAVVYLGKDLKLERRVAIKVMDPQLALMPGMADRFLQEARIAARLQHPNIIVVHDIRQEQELIWFVMGFVEGASLDDICRRPEPRTIDEVRWVLMRAARALAYAHGEGIVHRDIKPANIMVSVKGELVITDFGIAKAVDGTSLTRTGTQVGTPIYMSPEQFSDQPVGPAADQYALGITAYQLLTGQPPFSGDVYRLINAHGNQQPVPIRERRPDCPAFLANAVMRMLAKQPEDRWPSLDDVAEVCGANLPSDGGAGRRSLALLAGAVQAERVTQIPALQAHTPVSPVPGTPRPAPRAAPPIVTITPPAATIFVGGAVAFSVQVTSAAGDPVTGTSLLWSSSNPTVAKVGGDGRVHGVTSGHAEVQVTVQGVTATATVQVDVAPLARLLVEPPELELRVGDQQALTVRALDALGAPRRDVPVAWRIRSGAGEAAQVSADGMVSGVSPGESVVEAVVDRLVGEVAVRVLPRPVAAIRLSAPKTELELGDALPLVADCRDDRGLPVAAPVSWHSRDPGVVHVDARGVALAISGGMAVVEAAVGSVSATIDLRCLEAPIGSLAFAQTSATMVVGETRVLPLTVLDPQGGPRSSEGITCLCDRPECLAIDPKTFAATALAAGTVRLIAAPEGALRPDATGPRATCTITIRPVQAVSLQLSAGSLHCREGGEVTLEATARDAQRAPVQTVTWEPVMGDDQVAACLASPDGRFIIRGLRAGETRLLVAARNADDSVISADISITVEAVAPTVEAPAALPPMADPEVAPPPLDRPLPEPSREALLKGNVSSTPIWRRPPVLAGGVACLLVFGWLLVGRSNDGPEAPAPAVEEPSIAGASPAPAPTGDGPAEFGPDATPAIGSTGASTRGSALPATETPAVAVPRLPRRGTGAGTVAGAVPKGISGEPPAGSSERVNPQATAGERPAAPAPTPPPTSSDAAPVRTAPSAADVASAVDALVRRLRTAGLPGPELAAFYRDGEEHRARLLGSPTVVSEEGGVARVQFDVRLEKFDGAGRPFNRQAQIVVDITRRGGDVDVTPVSVGPLQRTR